MGRELGLNITPLSRSCGVSVRINRRGGDQVRARTLRLSTRAQNSGEEMARKRHARPHPGGPVTEF